MSFSLEKTKIKEKRKQKGNVFIQIITLGFIRLFLNYMLK